MTAGGTVVQVEGLRQLRAALNQLGDDLGDMSEVNSRVGSIVIGAASPRVHSRSGSLAGSGRAGTAKTRAVVRYGGARIPYANAVHWGTGPRRGLRGPHNIAPNTFVVDAAHATEPTWVDLFMAEVERRIDEAAARCHQS